MNKNNHLKISGYAGVIGSVQFIILPIIAMFFYGGGTAWGNTAEGYTFWQNFLSDLGRTVSYSGVENTVSSPLFNFSLGLFGITLILLYSASFRLFSFVFAGFSFISNLTPVQIGRKSSYFDLCNSMDLRYGFPQLPLRKCPNSTHGRKAKKLSKFCSFSMPQPAVTPHDSQPRQSRTIGAEHLARAMDHPLRRP